MSLNTNSIGSMYKSEGKTVFTPACTHPESQLSSRSRTGRAKLVVRRSQLCKPIWLGFLYCRFRFSADRNGLGPGRQQMYERGEDWRDRAARDPVFPALPFRCLYRLSCLISNFTLQTVISTVQFARSHVLSTGQWTQPHSTLPVTFVYVPSPDRQALAFSWSTGTDRSCTTGDG